MIGEIIFWFFEASILISIFALFRITWVCRRRIEWMDQSFSHFDAHAPSFDSMVLRFWVWDARKFGSPVRKVAK